MKKILFLSAALLVAGMSLSLEAQQLKIGVCTSVANAQKVKDAGGEYIEASVSGFLIPLKSDAEFAENVALAKASPLPIYACNGFFTRDIKLTGPERNHALALEYAEVACRRAKMLGIKRLVLGSSGARNYPEGYDKQTAINEFIELLKKMGPIAAKYDVVVVLEPLQKSESNFMNTVAEGVDIVKRTGHKNIRCLADIFHMLMADEGPEVLIKEKKYIYHTHVAEKQGRAAPGTNGEDLTPYYRALEKARYKGGLSIEARWDDFDKQLVPAIANLKKNTSKTSK